MFLLKLPILLVAIWALAAACHWCLFALLALPRRRIAESSSPPSLPALLPIQVLIPAYRSGRELCEAVRSVIRQQAECAALEVVVIADQCDEEVCRECEEAGARVLRVAFDKSTKVRALLTGLASLSLSDDHADPIILILDADNLIAPGFLAGLARSFASGAPVVQARRVARNWNTETAQLDMISEALNNAVFRRARVRLGLPAALIGSAMAFRASLLRRLLPRLRAVGGFDKELEMLLVTARIPVAYAEDALCFDEKLVTRADFVLQKRRWLSAQFVYLGRLTRLFLASPTRMNPAALDKWLQWLFPPRLLLLILLPAVAVVSWAFFFMLAAALALSLSAMLLLHLLLLSREGLLPLAPRLAAHACRMALAYLRVTLSLRGANRTFLHTPHGEAVSLQQLAYEIERAPILPVGVREVFAGMPGPPPPHASTAPLRGGRS